MADSEDGAGRAWQEVVAALARHTERQRLFGTWAVRRSAGSAKGSADATAVAPVSASPASGDATLPAMSLSQIRAELGDCTRCKLANGRQHLVFGNGAENAALMFVGEAPGADEDRLGDPFVGRAGEALNKMIEAMGWRRQQVYVANVVKCRPPDNRNPEPDEIAACRPFLWAQIRAVAPRVIVALGRPAANFLLENDAPISTLRGTFHHAAGFKIMPTFHPAYLLRQPEKKREAWHDLKLVMDELARLQLAPGSAR